MYNGEIKFVGCVMLQEMYSEVPVPKSLEGGRSFDFLRRDLRRTGLLQSPGGPGGGGGFDSSLHGGGHMAGGMGGGGSYSSSGLSNSSLHGGGIGHIGGG